MSKPPSEMNENELASIVIDISFQIHKKWGPGLLESAYEALLDHRLRILRKRCVRCGLCEIKYFSAVA